jgi:hypothetical protein
MSLKDKEKKATSDPAMTNERKSKKQIKMRNPESCWSEAINETAK